MNQEEMKKEFCGEDVLERPSNPLHIEMLAIPDYIQSEIDDILLEHDHKVELRKEKLRTSCRILFVGPPGTGKTVMARVLAHNLKLDFFQVRQDKMVHHLYGFEERMMGALWDAMNPSEDHKNEVEKELKAVQKKYHGSAQCTMCGNDVPKCACPAKNQMDQLAAHLKTLQDSGKPRVVFMDEIEAVASARGKGDTPKDKALNILLTNLEAYEGDSFFIGATNMADTLDPAIFRRFDRVIEFQMPNEEQRRAAFEIRMKDRDNVTAEDIEEATVMSNGLSFSEIRMAIDRALKRSIVKKEKKQLGKILRFTTASEKRALALRTKGHLQKPVGVTDLGIGQALRSGAKTFTDSQTV